MRIGLNFRRVFLTSLLFCQFVVPFVVLIALTFVSAHSAAAQTVQNEPAPESSPTPTARGFFESGLSAFRKNELEKARLAFHEALKQEPDSASSLFNLALVEERLGRLGLAIGLWRMALAQDPEYRPAHEALRWAKTKLDRAQIPHEVESWETLRSALFVRHSLWKFFALSALFFFLGGWLTLKYFGLRRLALLEEKPTPAFPVTATIFAFGFVVSAGLTAAKLLDIQTERGTIVLKKVEARSTPDATGTALFDLYEGLEVIIKHNSGDWVQVTYPGGSTGWIPKISVLSTTDQVAL